MLAGLASNLSKGEARPPNGQKMNKQELCLHAIQLDSSLAEVSDDRLGRTLDACFNWMHSAFFVCPSK